jgi:hypothetical protein
MNDVDRLDLRRCPDGVVLPVKAVPNASRDKVVGVLGDALKVATAAAPEKGKANAALARTLAKALGVSPKAVRIASGPSSPRKEFHVQGVTIEQVRSMLRSS